MKGKGKNSKNKNSSNTPISNDTLLNNTCIDNKESLHLKQRILKLSLVIISFIIFLLLKEKTFHSKVQSGNKFDIALDVVFDSATKFLSQNLMYRNFTIIYSGLWLDTVCIIFLVLYVYRGTGFKEVVAFVCFYGARGIFMACFELDYPKLNINEDPGFFSMVAPHGRSADYFYSGHTGFSFLCSLFCLEYKHFYLFIVGGFVTLIQIFCILITRVHYVIDAYIGFFASHYFYMISPKIGKFINRVIPIHDD